ncbi:FtsK/SpoIIIE family DNA translocase [Paenibacillus thermotolerans]|uniref:FtsK/SpoIIIE family DNA translocase n=1 Tax=Paenibacillus thermotolerans TaxID=3027807 RepID=UPI0023688798|nr:MULTISPECIES: DNA translocase FtsK [unclassified Paenibacillus]
MAKSRKKRKKSMSSNLKFELYGILLLIFSVITLAREGSVGKSIAFLFRILVGNWEPVLSAILIYIAVYHLMIKRSWPNSWSVKYTGVLLLLLGLLISSHSGLFSKLVPDGGYTPSWVVSQTWESLMSHITPAGIEFKGKDAGGGMVGGMLYAALYVLFGQWGAKLIQLTLYAVGFLLVTGLSYVKLMGMVKRMLNKSFSRVSIGAKETIQLLHERAGGVAAEGSAVVKRKAHRTPPPLDIDEEFDEERWKPPEAKKQKRKLFFDLFSSSGQRKPKNKEEAAAEEIVAETDASAAQDPDAGETVLYAADGDGHEPYGFAKTETGNALDDMPKHDDASEPVFVDFLDQVRQSAQDDDSDLPEYREPAREAAPEATSGDAAAAHEPSGEDDVAAEKAAGKPPIPVRPPYRLPPFGLMAKPGGGKGGESADQQARENARKLEATLESFGVRAKVLQVVRGPAVTRYEIQPDIGVKVSRIVSLTDDIALALAAKDIRMEAPIPGKSAIGIEVPNTEVSVVSLREVMETSAFRESDSRLTIALGRDISGQPIVANLAKMPHLLVAGATGSGKSVCINGIITSILYKAKPNEVKFLMVDPKMVELNVYNGIPHLLAPVVTDPRRASLALKKIVVEMEKRYEAFSKSGTRNIEGYNAQLVEKGEEPLPYIVVIVDELADLMMVAAGDVEDAICRLAQMARAAGIHLIIATQRPSVDVITGVIKANIPSRIAFGVSSQVDSRTILDMAGAEKLLGRGDMLFMPVGASKAMRVQGAFLSDNEVEAVTAFCRDQEKAQYNDELVPEVNDSADEQEEQLDELFDQAVGIVLEAKQASVSLLQRRMRIGYTRAARLIDQMEFKGVVGPYEGSKPREVLMSYEQYRGGRMSS